MQIQLYPPLSFSQIGRRASNQDWLWPTEADASSRLFVVCDGMGGTDRGDVASQLLAEAVGQYVRAWNNPVLDQAHLQAALDGAYETYAHFLERHPIVNRMGSTLALVQFHERGATVAHIGDSRVYWLRDGEILFETKDHKQVNELVAAGVLTAKQAQNHPWRNLLSRAVLLQRDETGQVARPATPMLPDLEIITDLRAGDYFFLCTDGTLETITPCALTTILNSPLSEPEKLQTLLGLCEGRTNDNYSAYLIRVERVAKSPIHSVEAAPAMPEPIQYP